MSGIRFLTDRDLCAKNRKKVRTKLFAFTFCIATLFLSRSPIPNRFYLHIRFFQRVFKGKHIGGKIGIRLNMARRRGFLNKQGCGRC